jgi:hypothetical protein
MGHKNTQQQGGSLSLTAVDDPVALAKNMSMLYGNKSLYTNKVAMKHRS